MDDASKTRSRPPGKGPARINILPLLAALALTAAPALAQTPGTPEPKTFTSSAEIQALIANARQTHKPGTPNMVQRIVGLPPYVANLEHRTAVGPAAVHEKEAELFYVIEGSGTLVTGGKLTHETRANPANLSGDGVEGGQSRPVAKGDVFIVPENTPHWFSAVNGELILMSLHVPRG
jgi:mannose-6-phosphate isomerase-like protein (cupin superfamily)